MHLLQCQRLHTDIKMVRDPASNRALQPVLSSKYQNLLFLCCSSVVPLLFLCCSSVVPLLFLCCSSVVPLLFLS